MLLFRLADLSPARSQWWAVCEVPACRANGPVDLRPWVTSGGRGPPLASLENRLRCSCGARRARLTQDPPGNATAPFRPAPYLFV